MSGSSASLRPRGAAGSMLCQEPQSTDSAPMAMQGRRWKRLILRPQEEGIVVDMPYPANLSKEDLKQLPHYWNCFCAEKFEEVPPWAINFLHDFPFWSKEAIDRFVDAAVHGVEPWSPSESIDNSVRSEMSPLSKELLRGQAQLMEPSENESETVAMDTAEALLCGDDTYDMNCA